MSERWKPEDVYYFVDSIGMVGIHKWFNDSADNAYYESGNCFKTEAEAKAASEKVKAILLSLHKPVTACNQLPKLTAEVFNRPDCPVWAKYAAVDKNGAVRFHAEEPHVPTTFDGEWWCSEGNDSFIVGKFDASDWKNSLIERPSKLPDWCEVGEWVWCIDSEKYAKIKSIDNNGTLYFNDDKYHSVYARQARLRPYNEEEMKALVGKPITMIDGAVSLCTAYSKRDKSVILSGMRWDAQDILDSGYTIDGQPCGKFEHLENGEWVR